MATQFAGGVNPWSGVKQSAKPKQKRNLVCVDVSTLQIVNDPMPTRRISIGLKYEGVFSKLKPGQAVKCQPDEAPKICNALSSWLKKKGRRDQYHIRSVSRYETDGLGRVWLIPKKGEK